MSNLVKLHFSYTVASIEAVIEAIEFRLVHLNAQDGANEQPIKGEIARLQEFMATLEYEVENV